MEQITIRPAVIADLPILLSFEQGIVTAERPFDSTLKDGEIHYYDLAEYIAAPDIEVIVAEVDGEVVGSAYAKILNAKPYLKHRQYAYLGFMYVKPEHRGKGINQQIIDALKAWAASRGLTELRLEVYSDNLPALKAYEKAGFSKNLVEMRLGLGNTDL